MAPAKIAGKPKQQAPKTAAAVQGVPFPAASVAALLEAVVGGATASAASGVSDVVQKSTVTVQEVNDDVVSSVRSDDGDDDNGSAGSDSRCPLQGGKAEASEAESGSCNLCEGEADDDMDELEDDNDDDDANDDHDDDSAHSSQVDLVNHMYELFTSTQGVNVTEALLQIKEALDKTNKILFKILAVTGQQQAGR